MFVESCSDYSSPSIVTTIFIIFTVYRLVSNFVQSLHKDDVCAIAVVEV